MTHAPQNLSECKVAKQQNFYFEITSSFTPEHAFFRSPKISENGGEVAKSL